jgi:uncharacterized protein (DUF1778 family)
MSQVSTGRQPEDFMVETTRQAAQDALLDQTFRAAFVARLDAPPAPNEKLRRMTAPAPWDE